MSKGIGIIGLLGIAFIVLKLTGFISWSWWLITLPFWGGFAWFLFAWIFIYINYYLLERKLRQRNRARS